ncbi:118aa long hypothetical protein [Pyrococcus horikoshii OT3]|uniref:Uncharacterized protein n=1 Tax=Pyrococcus horikoshii (strain ATCC 700860 / DSM 12428 / JCM 9974 / NBRC 100139 / OT-3) TaxID=70601 RepID=O74082_PYRHO|nr:118aa long hypothetical protein [Pyrococcus horikoshii OT3]
MVTGFPKGLSFMLTYFSTGSSKLRAPSSASFIIANAVKLLVIEPIPYIVSGVDGSLASTFLYPKPFAYMTSPSLIMLILIPGTFFSDIFSTIKLSSSTNSMVITIRELTSLNFRFFSM